jgi:hypothetical protein
VTDAFALDLVVSRTGHRRYRDLCDPAHPAYDPGYPAAVRAMAEALAGEPAPAPVLPGFLAMARAFFGASVRHVAAGMPAVTDEVYEARLAVCESCPNLRLPEWRCAGMAGCGCYLKSTNLHPGKARWATQTCPLDRWPKPTEGTADATIPTDR